VIRGTRLREGDLVPKYGVFIREQANVRPCGATTGGEANFRTGINPVRADKLQDMRGNGMLGHARLKRWELGVGPDLQMLGAQGRSGVRVSHAPGQNELNPLTRSAARLRAGSGQQVPADENALC
jgi:hypothetical protein